MDSTIKAVFFFIQHSVLVGKIAPPIVLEYVGRRKKNNPYRGKKNSSSVQTNLVSVNRSMGIKLFQFIILFTANFISQCEQALQSFITTHGTVQPRLRRATAVWVQACRNCIRLFTLTKYTWPQWSPPPPLALSHTTLTFTLKKNERAYVAIIDSQCFPYKAL